MKLLNPFCHGRHVNVDGNWSHIITVKGIRIHQPKLILYQTPWTHFGPVFPPFSPALAHMCAAQFVNPSFQQTPALPARVKGPGRGNIQAYVFICGWECRMYSLFLFFFLLRAVAKGLQWIWRLPPLPPSWPRPWLIHVCDMTHSYAWHDSSIYLTWLFQVCDACDVCIHLHDTTHWEALPQERKKSTLYLQMKKSPLPLSAWQEPHIYIRLFHFKKGPIRANEKSPIHIVSSKWRSKSCVWLLESMKL